MSSVTAGREVRFHDRAGSGWMGADVQAAFLKSQQCLVVAKGKHHLQVCAFLHSGQVQHGIDQARAAPRGDVPGLGAQRHPGGSARSLGGDLGCGDGALIVADLDVPVQLPAWPCPPSCRGGAARQAGAYWRYRARCAATGHGGHPDAARRRRPDGQPVRYRSRCQVCSGLLTELTPGR